MFSALTQEEIERSSLESETHSFVIYALSALVIMDKIHLKKYVVTEASLVSGRTSVQKESPLFRV